MFVNKITLIRMKKIAYELKQKGAIDQTTGIEIKTNGKDTKRYLISSGVCSKKSLYRGAAGVGFKLRVIAFSSRVLNFYRIIQRSIV